MKFTLTKGGAFILAYHVILLVMIPFYAMNFTVTMGPIWWGIALFILTNISTTAGYHRLFSHKSYNAKKPIEAITLFFGAMALQGSALWWSFLHRLHHKYTDTDRDPYTIKKGFWYAHMLWIFDKQESIDEKWVADLTPNKLVMNQHKYYGWWVLVANGLAFVAAGFFTGDWMGSFMFALLIRFFLSHHTTWFINSLCHTWGEKPMSKEITAVDNYVLSIFTMGEGYHNYHHVFQADYRNGTKWWHFDPTKWTIYLLFKLGLASSLKKYTIYSHKYKMVLEQKSELMQKIKENVYVKRELIEKKMQEYSESISQYAQKLHTAWREYNEARVAEKRTIKARIKALEREFKLKYQSWGRFYKGVSRLRPNLV